MLELADHGDDAFCQKASTISEACNTVKDNLNHHPVSRQVNCIFITKSSVNTSNDCNLQFFQVGILVVLPVLDTLIFSTPYIKDLASGERGEQPIDQFCAGLAPLTLRRGEDEVGGTNDLLDIIDIMLAPKYHVFIPP